MKLTANSILTWLIGLIIVFGVLQIAIPRINWSLGNLSAAVPNAPFISFFASNGLVVLIIMAAVLLGVVALSGVGKGK
jgi:hypothetical protein